MLQAKNRQQLALQLNRLKLQIQSFSHWFIFPFEINTGAIGNSETGYKPLNAKVTDYGSYELIFTGDSPVICIWKGSTKIYQKNKGITDDKGKTTGQDQFYTKEYNIENAQKWESYLIEDISNVDFGETKSNTIFTNLSIGRQYTLISFDEQIKVNDYLQFFVVLNDFDVNIAGGNSSSQDRQLLYLSNVTNKYNPYTNEFYCQIITLSSVNDKASSSGMTVQSFIQYGGAGSGYAFPQFENNKLQFNKNLMKNIGVRYAHRQFYGMEALGSISYFGRPIIQGESPKQIEDKEIYEQKVYASRRLFIAGNNEFSTTDIKDNGGLLTGLNDPITTVSHPETTFYNLMDAKPTGFTNYNDWQEFLAAKQFNMLAEKSFKGMLQFTRDLAIKSNGTSTNDARFFWDSEWVIDNLQGKFDVTYSTNFRFKDEESGNLIGAISDFDYSKISKKWMSSILNFNSLMYSSLIQLPYSSEQWLPFSLSQIPLIGKMLNALLLGIPVGWVLTQNSKQYKKIQQLNLFMSAFYADSMNKIIGESGNLIPLNLFSTKSDFELGNQLGAKVSTTALLMKLTDRLNLYPWSLSTGKKLDVRERISSVDLSQKQGDKVYIADVDTEFIDIESSLSNKDEDLQWNPTSDGTAPTRHYAYIIDYMVTQSLGQGEERHTFYADNPYTYQGDYNEISVAQFKIRNQASFTDNLFNWTTQYKLNHDEYSETEETTFDYPAAILPADPKNIPKIIEIFPKELIIDLTENYTGIISSSYPVSSNIDNWLSNNPISNCVKEELIKIKDYLDDSLLINSMEDLKRYYQSIEINYDYTIITNKQINNIIVEDGPAVNVIFNYTANESFTNGKEKFNTLKLNLNDLVFKSNPKTSNTKYFYVNSDSPRLSTRNRLGNASVYYKNDYQYQFNGYKFEVIQKDNYNFAPVNYSFSNNQFIALNLDNSNNSLEWKLSIFGGLGVIETLFSSVKDGIGYAYDHISKINFKVTKITLIPR